MLNQPIVGRPTTLLLDDLNYLYNSPKLAKLRANYWDMPCPCGSDKKISKCCIGVTCGTLSKNEPTVSNIMHKEPTVVNEEDQQIDDFDNYPNADHKSHKFAKVKNKYRNRSCPCGSAKKFKKCCINKVD